MLVWGLAIGALLGFVLADFETWGAGLGGVVGLGALSWLRNAVRDEIAKLIDYERQTVDDIAGRRVDAALAQLRAAMMAGAPVAPPATAAKTASISATPPVLPTEPELLPEPEREPSPPPEPEPEPERESWLALGFDAVRGWIFGGNTIVRVGLIMLFVGLSFLARYAAMAGLFPIEMRLSLIAAAGIALLVVGFLRRTARPDFALALQGAGVAVLYLVIFGAARFFDLLPLLPAFTLMLVICALGCALALLQGSQILALAAFIGGFSVPLLLGGEGSSVRLFGYYAVLNVAALAVLWRTAWRMLALVAFFATFGVMGAWVATEYAPAEYATSQAFLALFMLVHVIMAVALARARPGPLGLVVDTTLLFGPALAGLGIQIAITDHLELGPAFSALGFAALYLVIAALLKRRGGPGYAMLIDALLAIGVGGITLAVPLALGAEWTSSVWAIEGAAAVWIGRRQARWLPRLFGVALAVVATVLFLGAIGANVSALPIVGRNTLGAAMIAAALILMAWWLRAPLPVAASRWAVLHADFERLLSAPLFLGGFGMWSLAIALEAGRRAPAPVVGDPPLPSLAPDIQALVAMLGILASAAAALWAGRRLAWPVATWPSRATLPLVALVFLGRANTGHFVLERPDILFWLPALGLHLVCLRRNDADGAPRSVQRVGHVGGVWLGVVMLANGLWFGVDRAHLWDSGWAAVVFLASGTAVLALLATMAGRGNREDTAAGLRWPLDTHAIAYWWQAAVPVAALVWSGILAVAFTANGNAEPLPYLPLLNPVDLVLVLALGALLLWQRCLATAEPQPSGAAALAGRAGTLLLAATAFLVANSIWLRIAHHYLGVAWSADAMLADPTVQAGLAIFWSLLALGVMLLAQRRGLRPLWLGGAGLLGAVVVKLLLVDMSSAEGGQRIVAFIGVGVLMLVVGYFVPLPPKAQEEAA